MKPGTVADAVISPCGLFRYALTRVWGVGRTCVFVMLNPSTADAVKDDRTIGRCTEFAKREGCAGLEVVNLFAFRATSPDDMFKAADPVGPLNDKYLLKAFNREGATVIAGWGVHGSFMGRDRRVIDLGGPRLCCLGRTKAGSPRHPLYVKGDKELEMFP